VSWIQNRAVRWTAGAVALCLLMVVMTWFLLVAPRRTQASDLHDSVLAAQSSNALMQSRIAELKVQYAKLPEQRAKLEEIGRQLPATDDVSGLLRSIDTLATSSGVGLTSISPGTATTGASGVQSIPVTMAVSGDYFQAVAFLRQLQTSLPRAILVSGLQIASGEGSKVQVTITGQVFTRSDTATTAASAKTSTAASAKASAEASASAGTAAVALAGAPAPGRSRW
jgi:type IV pilus assembly protein PilO